MNEIFPVFIIHELNENGTIRIKFFDMRVGNCSYDNTSISSFLNSTAFGEKSRNIYFLNNSGSWTNSKSELDENWLREKTIAEQNNTKKLNNKK